MKMWRSEDEYDDDDDDREEKCDDRREKKTKIIILRTMNEKKKIMKERNWWRKTWNNIQNYKSYTPQKLEDILKLIHRTCNRQKQLEKRGKESKNDLQNTHRHKHCKYLTTTVRRLAGLSD